MGRFRAILGVAMLPFDNHEQVAMRARTAIATAERLSREHGDKKLGQESKGRLQHRPQNIFI